MRRWVVMATLLMLAMGVAALPEAWAGDAEDCYHAAEPPGVPPATKVGTVSQILRAALAGTFTPASFAACRKLADRGDAKAQYNLGVMYDNGLGVELSPALALNWYRKAAD